MKKLSIILVLMIVSSAIFWHCSEKEVLEQEEKFIYYENLSEGVVSVEVADDNHPLFNRAISALHNYDNECLKGQEEVTFSNEVAIYTYDNGQIATIFATEDYSDVYFQLIDANTKKELEFVKVSISYKEGEDVSILFESLISDFNYLYDSESSNKSWGSCMEDAMSLLYGDWENDPAGTFACWVTGPLCAIGGGRACLF